MDSDVIAAAVFSLIAFMVYSALSTIEFGIGIFGVFPKLISDQKVVERALSPLWKVVNVFFIAGLVSLIFFFAKATPTASRVLLWPFVIAMACFLVRSGLYLYLFFNQRAAERRMAQGFFFITSLCLPVLVNLGAVYLIEGTLQWSSPLVWILSCLTIASVLSGCSSFMLHYKSEQQHQPLITFAKWAMLSYIALAGIALPLGITKRASYMFDSITFSLVFVVTAIVGAAWVYAMRAQRMGWVWPLSMLMNVGLLSVLFATHWPYLIFPSLTFADAFSAQAFVWKVIGGLGVSIILMLPGFWLLAGLMKDNPTSAVIYKKE